MLRGDNSATYYRWSWHGFKTNFKLGTQKSRDLIFWSFVKISTLYAAYKKFAISATILNILR